MITTLDMRIGGRYYKGVTDVSGLRPGLLINQRARRQWRQTALPRLAGFRRPQCQAADL